MNRNTAKPSLRKTKVKFEDVKEETQQWEGSEDIHPWLRQGTSKATQAYKNSLDPSAQSWIRER